MRSHTLSPVYDTREVPRLRPLGIGVPYMPGMPVDLYRDGHADFVEITPETLCRERRTGDRFSLEILPAALRNAKATCGDLPIVVHGVQLSIGSAHGWNSAYLDMLERFRDQWPFLWHSEHLGFQTITDIDGKVVETGVPLPMPNSESAAQLIIERCEHIKERFGLPFLLENPAHYLDAAMFDVAMQDDWLGDDVELINRVTGSGACGLLLDLHNLYCNAVNHNYDAFEAIDRLQLDRVEEIHLAGGSWEDGYLMDAHNNIVPHQVWDLLEYVLPRTPRVRGVVFEVLDRYAGQVGYEAMKRELAHARSIWNQHRRRVEKTEAIQEL